MPGIEIKGRSKIANYRHGGRTGKFGGGRTNLLEELGRVEAEPSNRNRRAEISRVHGELNRGYAKGGRAGFFHGRKVAQAMKKGSEAIKEHLARKEAKKVQAGKDEIRKSEMGYKTGGRAGFIKGGSSGRVPRQQRLSRGARLEKKKESIKDLIVKQKEEKKDYKPKSYLEKDTEKQAKTSELMKYGMPKKYKPFPQHMDWKTGPVKSDAYKKRVSDVADIHIAHGGEGFKKGGKADKKWIQKATKGMVKTKPCTGKKFGSKSCPPGSRRYNLAKTFKKMGRERKAEGQWQHGLKQNLKLPKFLR